jgi:hypothetical protein
MYALFKINFSAAKYIVEASNQMGPRYFSISGSSLRNNLITQEVSISPQLKKVLIARLKENQKQQPTNRLDCNCLPLKGTAEYDRMMEQIFVNLRKFHPPLK